MNTQPGGHYLSALAGGGQGSISLFIADISHPEAMKRLQEGWPVQGLDDPEHLHPRLLCIEKRPFPPNPDARPHERAAEVDRAHRAWGRISLEFDLLVRAGGAGVPRVHDRLLADMSGERPWENAILMEYVHGMSLWTLVEQGCGPNDDELVDLATALLGTFGGPDGTTGLHGRDIAHRDLMADQVVIPVRAGRLDWGHPVVVDLGYGFHPDVVFRDADGRPRPSTNPGGKFGYEPPERAAGYLAPERCALLEPANADVMHPDQRRRTLELSQRGDLWAWGMTIAYAATGTNVFDVRRDALGHGVYSDAWRAILRCEPVAAPGLASIPDSMRHAIALALHPNPELRDRGAIAGALPPNRNQRQLDAAGAIARDALLEAQQLLDTRTSELEVATGHQTWMRHELEKLGTRLHVEREDAERQLSAAMAEIEELRDRAVKSTAMLRDFLNGNATPALPGEPGAMAETASGEPASRIAPAPAPFNPVCACGSGLAYLSCHGKGTQPTRPKRPGPPTEGSIHISDLAPRPQPRTIPYNPVCSCGSGLAFLACHGKATTSRSSKPASSNPPEPARQAPTEPSNPLGLRYRPEDPRKTSTGDGTKATQEPAASTKPAHGSTKNPATTSTASPATTSTKDAPKKKLMSRLQAEAAMAKLGATRTQRFLAWWLWDWLWWPLFVLMFLAVPILLCPVLMWVYPRALQIALHAHLTDSSRLARLATFYGIAVVAAIGWAAAGFASLIAQVMTTAALRRTANSSGGRRFAMPRYIWRPGLLSLFSFGLISVCLWADKLALSANSVGPIHFH